MIMTQINSLYSKLLKTKGFKLKLKLRIYASKLMLHDFFNQKIILYNFILNVPVFWFIHNNKIEGKHVFLAVIILFYYKSLYCYTYPNKSRICPCLLFLCIKNVFKIIKTIGLIYTISSQTVEISSWYFSSYLMYSSIN